MRTKGWIGKWWLMAVAFMFVTLAAGLSAWAQNEIKVGVIGPMKFAYGSHMGYGAEMAAEKINAAGGITVQGKKYKVVLHKADDNAFLSTPDAVSAMERLATVQKVKFVLGGFKTESVLAQQEVMADNKIIFLGVGSAHEEQCLKVARDYNRYKYWFRVGPINSVEQVKQYFSATGPIIRELKNKLGITKPRIALLIDKAQWADPLAALGQKLFPQMGCEVVGTWRPSFTATSVAAELSAIKSANAHIVFVASAGPAGNVISKQWGELKIPAAMAGVNVEGTRDTHWKGTDGYCNYMVTSGASPQVESTPKTIPFLVEFAKRYKESPIYTGSGAYDALYVLKEAIERADSLDVEAVVPALEKTNSVGTLFKVAFTPLSHKTPHDVIAGPQNGISFGVQWRDGKQYAVWPDGHEIPPAIIAMGAPKGWDKVKFKGTKDYVLPPWVIEYWKGKK